MGNTESAAELLRGLEQVRQEALEEVQEAHRVLEEAKERYERAVVVAHNVGCTNIIIGEYAKRTETAIRLFLKRRRDSNG
jgi:hypothetical protein